MKIVSILNHKGGVGKTTVCGSLCQALALSGFRVLAIDNDSQHNLSSMLGTGVQTPSIRDVYRADGSQAPLVFLKAIRATVINKLHVVTACSGLCDGDVSGREFLADCLSACRLERFYDYILIDNAPGMAGLQTAALAASQEIFVPTELKQFAIDGIAEMEKSLTALFPNGPSMTRIIPNFYRNTRRQNAFLAALEQLFPGRVVKTAIVTDAVFDELVTDGKILFIHRLYSKGAAYYLKLMHELFELNEQEVWESLSAQRKEKMADDARQRLVDYRQKNRNEKELDL